MMRKVVDKLSLYGFLVHTFAHIFSSTRKAAIAWRCAWCDDRSAYDIVMQTTAGSLTVGAALTLGTCLFTRRQRDQLVYYYIHEPHSCNTCNELSVDTQIRPLFIILFVKHQKCRGFQLSLVRGQ